MIKKIIGIFLILVIILSFSMGVFAHPGILRQDGGHFEQIVVDELVAPEIVTWSAELIGEDLPNGIKEDTKISELNYGIEIYIKIFNNEITLGEKDGTLEMIEGEQIIDVGYKLLGQEKIAHFIFNVKKTIVSDAIYKKVVYVKNYHYHQGEFKNQCVNFYSDIKILWINRCEYYKENAPFITLSPSPILSVQTLVPINEITPTPEITNEATSTPEITEKPNIDNLPNTGENNLIIFYGLGFLIFIGGIVSFVKVKLN